MRSESKQQIRRPGDAATSAANILSRQQQERRRLDSAELSEQKQQDRDGAASAPGEVARSRGGVTGTATVRYIHGWLRHVGYRLRLPSWDDRSRQSLPEEQGYEVRKG